MDRPNRTPFHMFFYGTLKRGQRNDRFCRGALQVGEATVQGSLYDLPQGYPALIVPEHDIKAVGTGDPLHDARMGHDLGCAEAPATSEVAAVFGELCAFDDPAERFPEFDRLEEFVPGNPASPYRRVLIPALAADGVTLAWTYVVRYARGTRLPKGRWPA